MILFLLGVIDFISSIFVFLSIAKFTGFGGFVLALGIILMIKGLYSLGFSARFAAIQDMGGGAILLLMSAGIFLPAIIPAVFGFLMLVKSLQSIILYTIN